MAEFSKLVITDTGQTLLAKMIAGSSNIQFTNVSTSSTAYEEAQLHELNELSNVKQISLISRVSRTNETAIEVEAAFTNGDLTEGYHMRALGLYAIDPDEGEILYAVATELSGCCYMPAYNGVTLSGILLTLVTTVGNAQSVSLEVTPAGIATLKDVQTVRADIQSVKAQLGEHIVKSDVPANAIFANMIGATESEAGQAGYVPAPAAGEQGKFLSGDGTWKTPPDTNTTYSDMTGACASAAGTHGLVPAPAAGAQEKYLSGDGMWKPTIDTLEAIRANTQGGYMAGALALKEATGTVLSETLTAGATALELSSGAITDDSMIDVYTNTYGVCPTDMSYKNGKLTLTFDAQTKNVTVKVEVR